MKKPMKRFVLVAACIALACLLRGLGPINHVAAQDDGSQTKFFFTVISHAPMTTDFIVLSGAGRFGKNGILGVAGGGFTHYQVTAMAPFPIVAHGTYKATKLLSFKETPGSPYGEQISGVLKMEVEIRPVGGTSTTATMEVVCNVPQAPLITGEEEGVTLTVPGGLTFTPQTPAAGITLFNPANGED
jgi:hypothetical protein